MIEKRTEKRVADWYDRATQLLSDIVEEARERSAKLRHSSMIEISVDSPHVTVWTLLANGPTHRRAIDRFFHLKTDESDATVHQELSDNGALDLKVTATHAVAFMIEWCTDGPILVSTDL